jgi:hypothetical protein
MNLVTPEAGAKHEPLFNKPASARTSRGFKLRTLIYAEGSVRLSPSLR